MRRFKVAILASAVSLFAISSPAFAQVFSLSPSTVTGGSVQFTGASVDLEQTIKINCKVTVNATVAGSPGSNSMNVTSQSISAGNLFCGVLVYPYAPHPWKIEALNATGQLVRVYVSANTTTNKPCAGWVNGSIASDRRTINIVNATIPAVNAGDPSCKINGPIKADKDVYVL